MGSSIYDFLIFFVVIVVILHPLNPSFGIKKSQWESFSSKLKLWTSYIAGPFLLHTSIHQNKRQEFEEEKKMRKKKKIHLWFWIFRSFFLILFLIVYLEKVREKEIAKSTNKIFVILFFFCCTKIFTHPVMKSFHFVSFLHLLLLLLILLLNNV